MSLREPRAALEDANGHYNLGIALRRAGDWKGAALAFRSAARLNPRDFDAVQNVVNTVAQAVRAGAQPFGSADAAAEPAGSREPVSIVVCSIDEAKLARMRQSFTAALGAREHEFVVIRDARSLAEAYTRALDRCSHETVVFSHDDVELVGADAFDRLTAALQGCDAVGVAGSRRVSGPAVMWSGHPHVHGWVAYPAGDGFDATQFSLESGLLGGMQALDGFLLATRRAVVRAVGFDAAAFDGFHFYDLDFTYRAACAGMRLAVTTEITAIHASEGRFDADWQRYAERFRAKFPELAAPAGNYHSYGARLSSREELARFHQALRGLARVP